MNILLIEPDYKNKYPPIGLMKISTYHKMRGDNVVFYKGIMPKNEFCRLKIDRVYVTTLFTFFYSKTVKTINEYQRLMSPSNIFIGGIMATLMTEKLRDDIGNESVILPGLLTDSCVLDANDHINIDALPLDYSMLDDIVFKYPSGDNYFVYVSRGCTNKCPFCAVPILEPKFCLTNNIKNQINYIDKNFGRKQNLLLLDNNVLSLTDGELETVVEDIYSLGFDKKTKFFDELPFKTYLERLDQLTPNSSAFKNILQNMLDYLHEKKKQKKSQIYCEKYNDIIEIIDGTADKYSIIKKYNKELQEILGYYHRPSGRRRFVDFNQGIDARQLTRKKMQILSKIPIEPFRLAFDSIKYRNIYITAVKIAHDFGIDNFSNYLLYNYEDHPEELWERLHINITLSKELQIRIFSFPMKYAPIDQLDRSYVGKNWNKHFLRNIYAILNATKGIVGDGESFFFRAFGKNVKEFFEILTMPREFVLYRNYFEESHLTEQWKDMYYSLTDNEKKVLIRVLCNDTLPLPDNQKVREIKKLYEIKKG